MIQRQSTNINKLRVYLSETKDRSTSKQLGFKETHSIPNSDTTNSIR